MSRCSSVPTEEPKNQSSWLPVQRAASDGSGTVTKVAPRGQTNLTLQRMLATKDEIDPSSMDAFYAGQLQSQPDPFNYLLQTHQ
jgi:hypothetical protein